VVQAEFRNSSVTDGFDFALRLAARADQSTNSLLCIATIPFSMRPVNIVTPGDKRFHAKPLDEVHFVHLCRKIVYFDGAFACPVTILLVAQFETQIFCRGVRKIPFKQWLFVDRSDLLESLFFKING